MASDTDRVFSHIKKVGLLLEADSKLLSVATLVVGEPFKGSWWGHPKGRAIWRVLDDLTHKPDLLSVKLISGKLTLVHEDYWGSLLATAIAKDDWQTRQLSKSAQKLLDYVEAKGSIQTNDVAKFGSTKEVGTLARDLELRLLIYSEDVHMESGAHAKCLESWNAFMKRRSLNFGNLLNSEEGRNALESQVKKVYGTFSSKLWLAWMKFNLD